MSSQDKMHRIPSDGFLNLARSGTSNWTTDSNNVAASYWLSYPQESSYSNNPNWVKKFKEEGIAPASKKDKTIVLSYEPSVFHRNGGLAAICTWYFKRALPYPVQTQWFSVLQHRRTVITKGRPSHWNANPIWCFAITTSRC
ncbi:hypothetical protein [Algibacter lectus]|uniref:hypothetical protein n=1 Tax=Algibacter lectus TaxID=221126 RepID=UPI00187C5711|nr:hypothetical protein [Algibacter lectus]